MRTCDPKRWRHRVCPRRRSNAVSIVEISTRVIDYEIELSDGHRSGVRISRSASHHATAKTRSLRNRNDFDAWRKAANVQYENVHDEERRQQESIRPNHRESPREQIMQARFDDGCATTSFRDVGML